MEKNFPKLKIVDLSRLLVHEDVDRRRINLLFDDIKNNKIFTNPPLVAPLDGGKFVVLDGANRTTVFKKLGFKSIIVQIVQYGGASVELKTWNHIICGVDVKEFYDSIKKRLDSEVKYFRIKGDQIICRNIIFNDFINQIKALNIVVDYYKNNYKFYRLEDTKNIGSFCTRRHTIIVFPELKPKDILQIVKKGLRVPSGITRHVVAGRVLRIDFPMAVLKNSKSISWKNEQLSNHIKQKLENNKIRYYNEPVYIFND